MKQKLANVYFENKELFIRYFKVPGDQ